MEMSSSPLSNKKGPTPLEFDPFLLPLYHQHSVDITAMKWTSIFIEPRFDAVVVNDLFFECIRTRFWATNHFDHFRMLLPSAGLQRCYCLLCHDSAYLISLWRVYLRNTGLNFLISIRSGVFFRFFVVIYRDVPGMPEFLCSVHSRMTCTRLPFLAIFREIGVQI